MKIKLIEVGGSGINYEYFSIENPQNSRREFLGKGAVLLATPYGFHSANAQSPLLVGRLIWEFAKNIGFGVAGNFIYDWMKTNLDTQTQQESSKINKEMARLEFPNLGESTVFTPPKNDVYTNTSFMYQARDNNPKTADTCVVLHGKKELITTLEGLAMLALAYSADEMRKSRIESRFVRSALTAREADKQGLGRFTTGYKRPDVFDTALGHFEVNHAVSGSDLKTTIKVVDRTKNLLVDRDYIYRVLGEQIIKS